jgi:actin related protein 2/3 complex subunit 5
MAEEISEEQYAADLKAKQSSVKSLLMGHDKKGALEAALRKPPLGSKEQATKDSTSELVASILNQITENEIESVLAPLDNDMLDVLMKYLYRIMQDTEKGTNYGVILKMHDAIHSRAGIGSIMRAITERKTV